MRRLAAWAATFCLLWAGAAHAQGFADDFELGDLSRWSEVRNDDPAENTVAPSTLSAHRGTYGLRVEDVVTTSPNGLQSHLRNPLGGTEQEVYLRAWVRYSAPSPPGGPALSFLMIHGTVPSQTLSEAKVRVDGTLDVGGFNASGAYLSAPAGLSMPQGEWHLFEVAARGIGASSGSTALWLDGVEVAGRPVDFSGAATTSVLIAQAWNSGSWVGTLEYDDVRVSSLPHGSRLELSLATADTLVRGCAPARVRLVDSSGVARAAPYDVEVALLAPNATLHADAQCAGVPVGSVMLPAGAEEATAYVRPLRRGTQELQAMHPDFLPGAAQGTFAEELEVGCGCATFALGDYPLGVLGGLVWAARRRRSTR